MMSKIILLLLFITGVANAQIVSIPDANFKAKLIALGIDTNTDGEIQSNEALVPITLDVSGSFISDLTGIEAFVNLQTLDCYNNQLTSLDVTQNVNLQTLYCFNNQLTSLDVDQNVNLQTLHCVNNQLTSLDVAQNVNLQLLYCGNNQLTDLDVTQNVSLQNLACYSNQLTNLDVTQNVNLQTLNCHSNQLTNLDVTQNVNLQDLLRCSGNQLTNLDVTQNVNLQTLDCHSNQLTSLDVAQNVSLQTLDCHSNQLTDLDVTQNVSLQYLTCYSNQLTDLITQNVNLQHLYCYDNQLTDLDVTQNVNLLLLFCQTNQLTGLDLSQNLNLQDLACNDNQLTTLFIKNGITEDVHFPNNPNLAYICADKEEIAIVRSLAGASVEVNSYCSFTPGGNYNIITGTILFDVNDNGCDINDLPQPNIRIGINDGTNLDAAFTNSAGNYTFYKDAGSFNITPSIESPSWFNISPIAVNIPFADNNNNTVTQDFCITANGIRNDVEAVIAPITMAQPGFDAVYQLVYKNKGNQTLSGEINFTFEDTFLDFVSAADLDLVPITPDIQSIGALTFNYSNLLPFENRAIYITLNVNSPIDIQPVNIGDTLTFSTTINPIIGDEIAVDNNFTYKQTVVGSLSPNEITCLEGDTVPDTMIGEYLHYAINFENTGTDFAKNIVVETEIDPEDFDVNTLQLLHASDDVDTRIHNDVVEFIFENYRLYPGGHGTILMKIKTKGNLQAGDIVSETTTIYFDYNVPVETNIVNTLFAVDPTASIDEFNIDNSVSIYPNPTKDMVNVKARSVIKSIEIYDVQGRIVLITLTNKTQTSINISNITNGIYFLKITSEAGEKVERLIKE